MKLTKKELRRQITLNNSAFNPSLDEVFANYEAADEPPPPASQWSGIMLENIPEGVPNRNRTFRLFEEVRDLEMQWNFLVNPGPGVNKCCVRHG